MKLKTKNIKPITAWAIIEPNGVLALGSRCDFGNGHGHFMAVCNNEIEVESEKIKHKNFYAGCKIIKVLITPIK